MMLERQANLSFKQHRQLALYHSRCLAKVRMTKVTGEDAKALLGLSEWGFVLWLQFKSEAKNYELQEDSLEGGNANVVRIGHDAPPRQLGTGLSCNCKLSIAYGSICPHHVCYREGTFSLDDWPRRFHQVTALEKSSEAGIMQTVGAAVDVMEIEVESEVEGDQGAFPNAGLDDDDRDSDSDNDDCTSNKTTMASALGETRVQSKVDFGLMMDLSKSLAESVTRLRHSEREKFAGALVVLQKAASGNDGTPMALEEHLQSYLSCFSKYQTTNTFNTISEFTSSNNGGHGRLRSVRMQSRAERLMVNKKTKATCTLCKKPGHRAGRNCDLISSLKATLVPNDVVKTE
jgi:hypothetical protein